MAVTIQNVQTLETAPEGINLLLVKVETSQPGLYGWGCATFAYRHRAVACIVEEYLRPLLIGRDVTQIEDIWRLMHQNAYWRNGPAENNAISGVDMALWDIKGKMADMPVYQLLGGCCRTGIPVYRSANGRDIDELADRIYAYREEGVRYVRCQLNGYGGTFGKAPTTAPKGSPDGVYLDAAAYLRDTWKMFDRLRASFGDTLEFCHDVHERVSPMEAIQLAKGLEPYRLFFLEDAIPLEHMEWIRHLRSAARIPLAQGELINNPLEYHMIIQERLIDFIRVHISQLGGITPARKLQIFAEHFGVKTAWHGPGDMSPVGHAANIHLDLAASNFGIQEWAGLCAPNSILQPTLKGEDALREVFPGILEDRGGYVYPNEVPGLGVEVNERAASKYPCNTDVTLWTQTRRRDGTLIVP